MTRASTTPARARRGSSSATAPPPATGARSRSAARRTVSFGAEVDPAQTSHELVNAASATFLAPSLGRTLSAISDPARIEVKPTTQPPAEADVAVTERETDAGMPGGGQVLDAVDVADRGTDDGTCTVDALGVSCELPHIDGGGAAQIDATETVPPLQILSAPGARVVGTRACWTVATLDGHGSRSFSVTARAAPTAAAGTRILVPAHLAGENFAARSTRRSVDVRGRFSACPSVTTARHGLGHAAC
jgi:hypothetical protein